MMLHVRDCPGTTASFDVCPFPWCRKVKHLLYHLVSCAEPLVCLICSNVHLNRNMRQLKGLNYYRGEKFQAALIAKNKALAEAEAAAKQSVESQGSEGGTLESQVDCGKNARSVENGPPSDTEVDYSIVPPTEGTESLKHFVPATIKMEDDCGTVPPEDDTTSLSHGNDSTSHVIVDNAALVAATGDSTVSGTLDTLADCVGRSVHPLGDAIAEDFNSVTPDGTKG
jgi:TAZ zinc finger